MIKSGKAIRVLNNHVEVIQPSLGRLDNFQKSLSLTIASIWKLNNHYK